MIEWLAKDTSAWIALSLIAFGLIVYKFAGKSIATMLDQKIDKIKREIDEAENLRVEAQELLAQYQRKQRDAEKEAQSIIKNAEEHAQKIKQQAEADLDELMNRKEAQLRERLARIEENALAEIQNHAAELAMNATAQIITDTLSKDIDQSLRKVTVASIPDSLN